MKVKLSEIPDAGLTLTERFNPTQMNLQTEELKFVAPLDVTADFHKEPDAVMVEVDARGRLEMICGRCLTVYTEPYGGHFELGYSVKGQFALDVTNDIRQEILLTYPVQFLCNPDCKGLCVSCGGNLNLGDCECSRRSDAITQA